jgi:hypothetical protein
VVDVKMDVKVDVSVVVACACVRVSICVLVDVVVLVLVPLNRLMILPSCEMMFCPRPKVLLDCLRPVSSIDGFTTDSMAGHSFLLAWTSMAGSAVTSTL